MKEIDILNGIANGEIKTGFKIKNKKGDIYEYIEGKRHFANVKDKMYIWSLGDFTRLNNEIEVLEEDKEIKPLKLNDSDVWTGKSDGELIVEKINELVKAVNELKKGK